MLNQVKKSISGFANSQNEVGCFFISYFSALRVYIIYHVKTHSLWAFQSKMSSKNSCLFCCL